MNKSDLRTGMMVTYRNGLTRTVNVEKQRFECDDGMHSMNFSRYNDDLTIRDYSTSDYDIVEIYNTIWKRKPEPKRMTKAEIETALGHPIEVVQEVREIKRRAKIYEHIKIVKQGLHVPNLNIGDIHRVINVDGDGSIDTDKENVFSGEQHDEYVVLLGYQPEATHE
jgi:hypothetical protein